MKRRFWKWLRFRFERASNWIYWNKIAEPMGIPPEVQRIVDDTFDISHWGKVQWPTRSVAHEIYTEAPRYWAVPPNWAEQDCICLRPHDSYPLAHEINESCPVHGTTADPKSLPPKGW